MFMTKYMYHKISVQTTYRGNPSRLPPPKQGGLKKLQYMLYNVEISEASTILE